MLVADRGNPSPSECQSGANNSGGTAIGRDIGHRSTDAQHRHSNTCCRVLPFAQYIIFYGLRLGRVHSDTKRCHISDTSVEWHWPVLTSPVPAVGHSIPLQPSMMGRTALASTASTDGMKVGQREPEVSVIFS